MQYYDFQPDLTKAMPILSNTKLILTDNVDPDSVQDVLIQELLPGAYHMLGTKVRLIIVTVTIVHDIAYWDLIFEYPDYSTALPLLEEITKNSLEIEGAYEHFTLNDAQSIYKLAFKVEG